ncbi:UNVERIFIED_CONTAM: hypothetical protein Sradi_2357700 [Sesamum radiatum]|uniref:Uncharacterized protein n=1 Tax=Sesamum radiatum TaxID=300843 RepID=A0AAW2T6T1_SESRA
MNWVQMMIFYAAGPSYFSSYHDGVSDDGRKSCPTDVVSSSYYYGNCPCDYMSGLAHYFYNVVHTANQPLWSDYTQSQLVLMAGLEAIKANDHISERSYDQISHWANNILLSSHTMPRDYYSTKKLIKDLGLPIEKNYACKNGCMMYWKDDINLEYCKFCGDARYKQRREQDPRRKKYTRKK